MNAADHISNTLGSRLTQRFTYSGSNVDYVGEAYPGVAEGDLKWRIKKLSYDGSGNPTAVNFADKSGDFDKSWTLRATYSYA